MIVRWSYFLLGAAFGLTLAVFHAIASGASPGEGFPYQSITTKQGLNCVVFLREADKSVSWGTCNWDEYNFRQWHSTPAPAHPPIKKGELPI